MKHINNTSKHPHLRNSILLVLFFFIFSLSVKANYITYNEDLTQISANLSNLQSMDNINENSTTQGILIADKTAYDAYIGKIVFGAGSNSKISLLPGSINYTYRGQDGERPIIFFDFVNPLTITNSSYVEFLGRGNNPGAPVDFNIDAVFYDSSHCTLSWDISGDYVTNDLICDHPNNPYLRDSLEIKNPHFQNITNTTITFGNVSKYLSTNEKYKFNKAFFIFNPVQSGGVADDLILYNIGFYAFNGTNQYPNVNISFADICVESTLNVTEINYNISYYDPESDTVYFNLNNEFRFTKSSKISEYFETTLGGFPLKNYAIRDSLIVDDTYCDITTKRYNDTFMNILEYENYYMLSMGENCHSYKYELPYTVINGQYETEVWGLDNNQENFSITYLDEDNDAIISVLFDVVNTTHIGLFIANESCSGPPVSCITWQNKEYFTIPDKFFRFYVYKNPGENNIYIANDYTQTSYSFTSLSSKPLRFIETHGENGAIYQRYFTLDGWLANYTYSTSITGYVNVSAGYNYVTLRYFDSENYGIPYTINETIHIRLCSVDDSYTQTSYSTSELDNKFDPLYFFRVTFGNSFNTYLTKTGYDIYVLPIMYILWFLLLIFMIFILGISLKSSFFASSITFLGIAFVSSLNVVGFFILTAIGSALIFSEVL